LQYVIKFQKAKQNFHFQLFIFQLRYIISLAIYFLLNETIILKQYFKQNDINQLKKQLLEIEPLIKLQIL